MRSESRSIAEKLTWLAFAFVVAAGASLVWPVNNPYLSGECVPKARADGGCPVEWGQIDGGDVRGAVVLTGILVAFVLFPLLHRRWYARLVAAVPLVVFGVLGLFVFGPIYVPAMVAMLAATASSRPVVDRTLDPK
jgi:hypothetical protein